MRIQPGAWASVLTRPVELQNLLRLLDKRRIVLRHRSRLLFFALIIQILVPVTLIPIVPEDR